MKPMKTGWKRILLLADFMEKLPGKRFDFRTFVGGDWKGAADLSCGTAACALGWATTMPVFRRLGLRVTADRCIELQGEPMNAPLTLPKFLRIFDIDNETKFRLFFPGSSSFLFFPGDYLPANATPKQWASHARKIVKELQGEV